MAYISHLLSETTKAVPILVHGKPTALPREVSTHPKFGPSHEVKLLTDILNVHFPVFKETNASGH